MKLKPALKSITPPALLPVWHRIAPRPEWRFVADHWPYGDPRVNGWDHGSIVEAQRRKWPSFISALSGTSPLGISHEDDVGNRVSLWAHNAVMTYAYVLARAGIRGGPVSVLDFGGGLGHYFALGCELLPELRLDYTVVDLPGLCSAGRELLPSVRFEAEEAWKSRRYALVLSSGSLQYAAEWDRLLLALAGAAEEWVYVTRIPIVRRCAGFVISQRPDHAGYATEYIGWVLKHDELVSNARSAGLELEREFFISEHSFVVGAPEQPRYFGYLFRKTSS
jgi:putative methyltransferase (TIGR04325 family)